MQPKRSIPYLTLTEVVNLYMMASFNERRKYFLNYLALAKMAWKEIYTGTIQEVVSRYVEVDKTSKPYSIPFPSNCLRLLNIIEVDDCNNLQPLAVDDFMNTHVLPEKKNLSCKKHKDCGCEDALCDAIDSMTVVLKDIFIDDIPYVEKIWHRRYDNGDMLEVIESHVNSFFTDSQGRNAGHIVVPDVRERLICKFEVNSCGCVLPTPENKELLKKHCGCLLPYYIKDKCETVLRKTNNEFGRWKVDNDRIVVDTEADFLIQTFQTNGEIDGEEILVDEDAVKAVMFGITFFSVAFAPNRNTNSITTADRLYKGAKFDLAGFRDPIRIDEFMKISEGFSKW